METGRIRLLEAPLPKSDEEEDWREIGSIDPVTVYSTPDLPCAAQHSFLFEETPAVKGVTFPRS